MDDEVPWYGLLALFLLTGCLIGAFVHGIHELGIHNAWVTECKRHGGMPALDSCLQADAGVTW